MWGLRSPRPLPLVLFSEAHEVWLPLLLLSLLIQGQKDIRSQINVMLLPPWSRFLFQIAATAEGIFRDSLLDQCFVSLSCLRKSAPGAFLPPSLLPFYIPPFLPLFLSFSFSFQSGTDLNLFKSWKEGLNSEGRGWKCRVKIKGSDEVVLEEMEGERSRTLH